MDPAHGVGLAKPALARSSQPAAGDASPAPPWPQPKSLAAAPLVVFKQALSNRAGPGRNSFHRKRRRTSKVQIVRVTTACRHGTGSPADGICRHRQLTLILFIVAQTN